jgi:hypothetical protein
MVTKAKKLMRTKKPSKAEGTVKGLDDLTYNLQPLYHIESLADNVGELASALHGLANATAMSVIAKNGTQDDRAVAVEYLKRWFDDFKH